MGEMNSVWEKARKTTRTSTRRSKAASLLQVRLGKGRIKTGERGED